MGGKLFIPDRNFCVGVDDSSLPIYREGQDLATGDAKPPEEQGGGKMEVEPTGESGFHPWESTSGSDTPLGWHGKMLVRQSVKQGGP